MGCMQARACSDCHRKAPWKKTADKRRLRPRNAPLLSAARGSPENAPEKRFHGPIAEGRKPAGKGLSPDPMLAIRPRLPGRARNMPADGQAGAGGFDEGQTRHEGKGRCLPNCSIPSLAATSDRALLRACARQSQGNAVTASRWRSGKGPEASGGGGPSFGWDRWTRLGPRAHHPRLRRHLDRAWQRRCRSRDR